MSESGFTVIAAVEDIEANGFSTFVKNRVGIVICRFRDEFFALENCCSHARSAFDGGRMKGYRILCPMHGAAFDIRDGSAASAPARKPIRTFPVRVRNGRVEVDLSDPD